MLGLKLTLGSGRKVGTTATQTATKSVVFCRNGFSLYQYGGLARPHLMLNQMVQYNIRINTAVTDRLPAPSNTTPCSFLLVFEDSDSLIALIPLPKWRKKPLSREGHRCQYACAGAGSVVTGRVAGHTQHACAQAESSGSTHKHQWMKSPQVPAAAP